MRRWIACLTLPALVLAAPAPADDAGQAVESVAATLIALEAPAELETAGSFQALRLGQVLGPGDRVRTGEGGGLQLILADGSSVALGPNTELSLEALGPGGQGSNTVLRLFRGLLNAIVEKSGAEASFEIHSADAVAAVKGTDFEVRCSTEETVVTVSEGIVQLGDAGRKRFEPVLPLHRRRLRLGRLLGAEALSKRELRPFRERWARARIFHAQRHELLKHFREENRTERLRFHRELLKRRSWRKAQAGGASKPPAKWEEQNALTEQPGRRRR
jgi:ferric-dicitrate binding protein FerR (iron transport regulator)